MVGNKKQAASFSNYLPIIVLFLVGNEAFDAKSIPNPQFKSLKMSKLVSVMFVGKVYVLKLASTVWFFPFRLGLWNRLAQSIHSAGIRASFLCCLRIASQPVI